MTGRDWIFLIGGILGGGAVGAIITLVGTKVRNRRQPVGYKIETIDILRKNPSHTVQWLMMSIENPIKGWGHTVNNVSLARITLINKGNQDIEEFQFGATLEGTNEAVDLRWETPDRHHTVESLKPIGLNHPTKELDFKIKPFNRGDEYIFNVYFIYEESPGSIKLSSPHSAKLVEIKSSLEIVVPSMLGMSVELLTNKIRRP